MFRKQRVAIAFVMTILLAATSIFPVQAGAKSEEISLLWEREFYGRLHSEIAKTSKGDTLLATYKSGEIRNQGVAYNFMKIDAKGKVKEKKRFESGPADIITYKGKTIIPLVNNTKQRLEFMDENYKILAHHPLPFGKQVYELVINDGVLALIARLPPTHDIQAVFYSLDTFKKIPPADIPITRYNGHVTSEKGADTKTFSIFGTTFAGNIVKEIPLKLPEFNNASYTTSIVKRNNHLYALIALRDSTQVYENSVILFKLDMQGNIIDSHLITRNDNWDSDYVIMGDQFIIAADKNYYIYNIPSFSLVKKISAGPERLALVSIGELFYYQLGKKGVFANTEGKTQFIIPTTSRPMTLNEKYFYLFNSYENSDLYSSTTGKLLLKNGGYIYTIHDNQIAAYTTSGSTTKVRLYEMKNK